MQKKLTITVAQDVHEALHRVIGRRHISQFIEDLVRPHVIPGDLEAGYRAMAEDEAREAEALEWSQLPRAKTPGLVSGSTTMTQ